MGQLGKRQRAEMRNPTQQMSSKTHFLFCFFLVIAIAVVVAVAIASGREKAAAAGSSALHLLNPKARN